MKKSISVFIVFIILFVSFCPNLTYANEGDGEIISNELYSIKLSSWAKVLSKSEEGSFSSVITDTDLDFTVKISFEKFSDTDINMVRDYLSDYKSDNSQIYDSIIDLKAKSYEAAEKSYANSSSFFPMDKEYSEINFKIIDKQIQNLFGVRSFSIMYNTLDATMNNFSEFSKIDIFIPTYNKGIYEINVTIPREQMNVKTMLRFSELITSLKLADHPAEENLPLILSANDNIQKAASGIYPAYTFKNYNMKPFYSKEMGLSFYYPDFFIPTDNITSFDGMKNAAFKIDPYTTFNVLAADSRDFTLDQAVASTFTSIEDGASFTKVNVLDSPNGKIYEVAYTYNKNDVKYEKRIYMMSSNGATVVYTFITTTQNPSYSLDNIIIRILITTKTFEKTQSNSVSSFTYSNRVFGDYAVNLPDSFKVQYIGNDDYKITSPDVNTFQIYIYQENLKKIVDFESASRLAGSDPNKMLSYNFSLPYNSTQSTFIGGRINYSEELSNIYRLNKYLDANNRLHYCYTVSIAKGDKLYSMLIDINSMLFKEDGKVGKTMPDTLNEIAQSFKLK